MTTIMNPARSLQRKVSKLEKDVFIDRIPLRYCLNFMFIEDNFIIPRLELAVSEH